MKLALIVLIGAIGVFATIFAAVRMRAAVKADAPRDRVLGYVALMLAVSALTLSLLRAL